MAKQSCIYFYPRRWIHYKFYMVCYFESKKQNLPIYLETSVENMFAIGDGAGITRGLSQAGASGVYVARVISSRL